MALNVIWLDDPASGKRELVGEVCRSAVDLEARMGWPVDLECAFKDGKLYLLQCRPVTTLAQDGRRQEDWSVESTTDS